MDENRGPQEAVYVMSIAARLAGVHPQTLRIYERKGLLKPARINSRRRYSEEDIRRTLLIQELTAQGVNLAGVKMILELRDSVTRMRERMLAMEEEMDRVRAGLEAQMEAMHRGLRNEIVLVPRSDLVLLKDLARFFPARRRRGDSGSEVDR
ncbi:MAG: MerR family transcriptional regulator [Candidatus Geothermincolia bacterium]